MGRWLHRASMRCPIWLSCAVPTKFKLYQGMPIEPAITAPPRTDGQKPWRNHLIVLTHNNGTTLPREARANAARIKDPEGSRLMLEITATCEQLARKAKEGEQRE